MEVKDKIKAARANKKITQEELSKMIGKTQATITKIETGETKNPGVDIALKIANALGEDVYFLFGDDSLKNPSIKVDTELIEKLSIENNSLKKQIEDKDFLIETLKNEKSMTKKYFVEIMITDYIFDINFINEQITEALDDEKREKLIQKKEDIIRIFKKNKELFIAFGFVTQIDFDNEYKEMKDNAESYYNLSDKDWFI